LARVARADQRQGEQQRVRLKPQAVGRLQQVAELVDAAGRERVGAPEELLRSAEAVQERARKAEERLEGWKAQGRWVLQPPGPQAGKARRQERQEALQVPTALLQAREQPGPTRRLEELPAWQQPEAQRAALP